MISSIQSDYNSTSQDNTKLVNNEKSSVFRGLLSESSKGEVSEKQDTVKSIAFGIASQFSDIKMQEAVYDELSNMSKNELLSFSKDMRNSASRYLSGMELNANSFSVTTGNGILNNGSENKNVETYFKNMSANEFNYFFSTMYESYMSMENDIENKQMSLNSDTYRNILVSYKNSLDDDFIINESYKKEETDDMEELKTLAKDIVSLLKTGLTVDEVEALRKLLIELKDKIREGNYSEEEIEDMLSKIEKAIASLQKRVMGEAIIEADSGDLKQEDASSADTVTSKLLERIDKAINKLEELKVGKNIKEPPANESEVLSLIKEFQNT